ncbi:type II toxin-antitoxin system RelE/ParE family toxin [Neorhizobium galegae]|uniref:type II toxin-antitoxin system RelE/ParE family toxin n=1 Tax=Neorhizobium galegae TaxID=399 RepID=UPI0006212CBE|nr:Hypothetical protein NGAL_HAMBI2566_61770 [Neorhizobium galegae bv. orientalis]
MTKEWAVLLHDEFDPEFSALPEEVQDEILAALPLLKAYGPQLGRPYADTLKGSAHANMKELRFKAADGVWLMRSIPNAGQSSWWQATNRAVVRCGSTKC